MLVQTTDTIMQSTGQHCSNLITSILDKFTEVPTEIEKNKLP